MFTGLSVQQLMTSLEGLPPLELLGTKLLQQHHDTTGGTWFPNRVPPELLIQATVQMIDYTRRCAGLTRKLADLPPVPLVSISLMEFSL